jgi:hypothetical protein
MDSNVQPKAWKRYLKISAWLGYQPEATVETQVIFVRMYLMADMIR